jgi:hypothetical protein
MTSSLVSRLGLSIGFFCAGWMIALIHTGRMDDVSFKIAAVAYCAGMFTSGASR